MGLAAFNRARARLAQEHKERVKALYETQSVKAKTERMEEVKAEIGKVNELAVKGETNPEVQEKIKPEAKSKKKSKSKKGK